MLNVIMTAISVLTILGGAYIVAESFMSDSTFMRIHRRTAPAIERVFGKLARVAAAVINGCVYVCNDLGSIVVLRVNGCWLEIKETVTRAAARQRYLASTSSYEQDCQKYSKTLPAFSDETERILRREGHWIGCMAKPRTINSVWGEREPEAVIWGESLHCGPKAPGLMRVWPKDYPPTSIRFEGRDGPTGWKPEGYVKRRYGQIASAKPNNSVEARRQARELERQHFKDKMKAIRAQKQADYPERYY